MNAKAEIGYILKGYPRLSEVFITNEIYLLEQAGVKLRLFSIKRETETHSHAVAQAIRAQVTYLPQVLSLTENKFSFWLRDTLPRFARAHFALFKQKPLAYVRTLAQALAMCLRYRSGAWWQPKKVFIKEFLQAGYIAREVLASGSIRHLHAHFCHGSANIAMFVSRLAGVPFSFTAHAKDIYQDKLNPGDLLPVKIHRAKFVATCTAANKAHLDSISLNGTPIHAIYHGLDTELFTPAPLRSESPRILAVGRLVEKKGFEYLVRACRLLKDEGFAFHCQIVGEEGEHSRFIKGLIKEQRLDDIVTLHGPATHHELREIYRRATIFALPCQIAEDGDRDGIPNVLAEAMACGLPVISTNISGIPELITDRVDGLLIPQKNVAALAEALATLLRDADLRQRLGAAAREKICRIFDAKKNTLVLKELIVS